MKNKSLYIILGIILVVILFTIFVGKTEGKYDTFAQCLEENDAVFYGAYWCPHCATQKAAFGKSKKYLPYVECSNPDRTTKEVCTEKNIGVQGGDGFPTWIFADGSRASGVQPMTILAEKTSCELPE